MNKKQLIKIGLKLITYAFFAYLFIALLFDNVSLFGRYEHYIIVTDSMEPVIDRYDIVVINKKFDYDTIREDEIIAFNTTINNQEVIVVHYIETIEDSNGERTYETISESGETDPWTLEDEDLVGTYLFKIPNLGRFLLFTQSTLGRIVVIIDVLLLYGIYVWLFKKSS
ncbi:MAG: signal peptidase I [Candidatus Izemoplasmataceae bacterium]